MMAEGTKSNIHPCKVCQQTFSRACKLAHHMKQHTWEENQLFGDVFSPPDDQSSLCASISSLKTYQCWVCSKVYRREGNLLRHYFTAHGIGKEEVPPNNDDEVFSSPECSSELKPMESMTSESTQHPHSMFECHICYKRLTQNSSLKSHMRKHTGERPYKCNKCSMSFGFYQCLWNHSQKHTEEKRYRCDVCHKSFFYYQSLWTHYRIHTGEKPFECLLCGARYIQFISLRTHIKKHLHDKTHGIKREKRGKKKLLTQLVKPFCHVHKAEMPYECEVCKKKFRLNLSLQKHMKCHDLAENLLSEHNLEEKKDQVCIKLGNNDNAKASACGMMKDHQIRQSLRKNSHEIYHCHICKKEFRNYMCLSLHMEKHLTNPSRTDLCRKSGITHKSAKHIPVTEQVHVNQKPFRCSQCPKSFSYSSCLYRHKRLHHKVISQLSHISERKNTTSMVQKSKSEMVLEEKNSFDSVSAISWEPGVDPLIEVDPLTLETPQSSQLERVTVKKLKCQTCSKVFIKPGFYKRHLHKHFKHLQHGVHKCEECSETFRYKSWKLRHQETAHRRMEKRENQYRQTDDQEATHDTANCHNIELNAESRHRAVQVNEDKQEAAYTRACKQVETLTSGYRQVAVGTNGNVQIQVTPCSSGAEQNMEHKRRINQVSPLRNNIKQETGLNRKEGKQELMLIRKESKQAAASSKKKGKQVTLTKGRKRGRPPKYPQNKNNNQLICQYCGTIFLRQEDIQIHQMLRACRLCGEEFCCGNMFCSHAFTCSAFPSDNMYLRQHQEGGENGFRVVVVDQQNEQPEMSDCSPSVVQWPMQKSSQVCPVSPVLIIDTGSSADEEDTKIYADPITDTSEEGNVVLQVCESEIPDPHYDNITTRMPSSSSSAHWDEMNSRSVGIPADIRKLRDVEGTVNGDHVYAQLEVNDVEVQDHNCDAALSQTSGTASSVTIVKPGETFKCMMCSKELPSFSDLTLHAMSHINIV